MIAIVLSQHYLWINELLVTNFPKLICLAQYSFEIRLCNPNTNIYFLPVTWKAFVDFFVFAVKL